MVQEPGNSSLVVLPPFSICPRYARWGIPLHKFTHIMYSGAYHIYNSFSGFSVGFCINKVEVICYQLWVRKIICRRFDWMLQRRYWAVRSQTKVDQASRAVGVRIADRWRVWGRRSRRDSDDEKRIAKAEAATGVQKPTLLCWVLLMVILCLLFLSG